MAPSLPCPELVERFRADLAALGPVKLPLGIAFSGGPDSLGLLLLVAAAFPGQVRAATVDHQLRSGSAEEAAAAAKVCAVLDVPHAILSADVHSGASVQAHARAARYQALGAWMRRDGISCLLTAHHLDDQAETLIMRLLRGGGVAGLAGIRARRSFAEGGDGAEILRPLLGWRRAELGEISATSGFEPASDPSNADESFDRVRIRRLLGETAWLDPAPLARSAAALADAEDALETMATALAAQGIVEGIDHLLLRAEHLPVELRRRLLLRCIRRFAPEAAPRGDQLTETLSALEAGRTVTLAGVKLSAAKAGWRIEPAPPRRR
ncbi:MAG TPA: tRNA lysidine(34) synthetase TilS [Allosphingosinicella sp.]|jgi:tRNA(Ile)-lysidine synthase